MKKKAAFFDRDGTLIKNVSYLSSHDQISFIEPALAIAKLCQDQGYELFVVTNQSGIARGFFDETFVKKTHIFLDSLLQEKHIFITDWYYCPHHPTCGNPPYQTICSCRKPNPGMLVQAAQDHHLDLANSLMFGDTQADIQAGFAAGCKSFLITDLIEKTISEVAKEIFNGTIES